MLISFKQGRNSASYRVSGWVYEESSQTWSVGGRTSLSYPDAPEGKFLVVDLYLVPYLNPPLLLAQLVKISVNDQAYQSYELTSRCVLRLRIARGSIGTAGLKIELGHPGYINPLALHDSTDERPIAVKLLAAWLFATDTEETEAAFAWSTQDTPFYELEPLPTTLQGKSISHQGALPPNFVIPAFYGQGNFSPITRFLSEGWAVGQDTLGSTWSNAALSRVALPGSDAPGPHILWMQMGALVSELLPFQEFSLFLGGVALGVFRCHVPEAVLAIPAPAELVHDREKLLLAFDLPRASRPCDIREVADRRLLAIRLTHLEIATVPGRLSWLVAERHDECSPIIPIATSARFLKESVQTFSAMVPAELGIELPALLRRFESLGENCEFGIVSRKLGVELLHMFRFGSVNLSGLLRGLSEEFAAVDDRSELALELSGLTRPEYLFSVARYRLRWHTYTYRDEVGEKAAFELQTTKYSYLRRKFLEGLRSSKKIYVAKRDPALSFEEASALLLALNKYGRNTLLYVECCSDSRKSGTVDYIGPGLMRGYISAFAPRDNVGNATDPTEWLKILGNAWSLDKEFNGSFRDGTSSD